MFEVLCVVGDSPGGPKIHIIIAKIMATILTMRRVNNYIVRSYRDIIVVTSSVTRRANNKHTVLEYKTNIAKYNKIK